MKINNKPIQISCGKPKTAKDISMLINYAHKLTENKTNRKNKEDNKNGR